MLVDTTLKRQVFKKAQSLCAVPYVYNADVDEYVLGADVYDLTGIIGDSIVIENAEGQSTKLKNEFTGQAIVENYSDRDWSFTAQCLDLQDSTLRTLFGAYTNTEHKLSMLPLNAPTIYVLIRIRFKDSDTPDVYLPKVQLSSQLSIGQLKSQAAQGNLRGTMYSHLCAVKDPTTTDGLIGVSSIDSESVSYVVDTPILFVSRSCTPIFLHHSSLVEGREYTFSHVNFTIVNGSSTTHNIYVSSGQSLDDQWVYIEE